jgi:hypothetical protein
MGNSIPYKLVIQGSLLNLLQIMEPTLSLNTIPWPVPSIAVLRPSNSAQTNIQFLYPSLYRRFISK